MPGIKFLKSSEFNFMKINSLKVVGCFCLHFRLLFFSYMLWDLCCFNTWVGLLHSAQSGLQFWPFVSLVCFQFSIWVALLQILGETLYSVDTVNISVHKTANIKWLEVGSNEAEWNGERQKRAMKALNTGMLTKNHYWIGRNAKV